MDPITPGIISGLIANAITHAATQTGRSAQLPHLNKDLRALLQAPTTRGAQGYSHPDAHHTDRVRRFLVSAEMETLVRKLFTFRVLNPSADTVPRVEEEFIALFHFHVPSAEVDDEAALRALFHDIAELCEQALHLAIENGSLAAHEALEGMRHRLLADRLAAIEGNLTFLRGGGIATTEESEQFIDEYLPLVAGRYGHLTPQSFDRQRKLHIDRLFVAPRFEPERRQTEAVPMEALISGLHRTLILGNPGGGKTTFTYKVAHLLSDAPKQQHLAGRSALPFFVTLRDYGVAKRERGCSVLEFIETAINADLQLKPPPGAVEYLLRTGRALVIFDGLDELLDTSQRRRISADVESFCTRFPECAVLVTSREVGYSQAPLGADLFTVWKVAPFNDEQANDYVRKWFDADDELTSKERNDKVEGFLRESAAVPDLRQSPLMLSLMCTMYRGANYMPRNRPDIYQKCAEMMFERWDRHRGIHAAVPYQSHLFYAMQHLAHWIYTGEDHQSGVTERRLIASAADYMEEWCADDRPGAEAAARDFVEFCRGRAWVFSDAGTTADGERLYTFTHRTFLEYFTARHLVRTAGGVDALGKQLLPHIREGGWDVVAQLALHIQDQSVAGATDQLLTSFLDAARQSEDAKERFLLYSFICRCLAFLIPKANVRRDITSSFLEDWIEDSVRELENGLSSNFTAQSTLGDLLSAADENRETITDAIVNTLTCIINEGNGELRSSLAGELGTEGLGIACWTSDRSLSTTRYWEGVSKKIREDCLERMCKLAETSPVLMAAMIDSPSGLSFSKAVDIYGFQYMFEQTPYRMFSGVSANLGPRRAIDIVCHPPNRLYTRDQGFFDEWTRLMLGHEPPWVENYEVVPLHWMLPQRSHEDDETPSDITPNERFVAFSGGALAGESALRGGDDADRHRFDKLLSDNSCCPATRPIVPLWRYRLAPDDSKPFPGEALHSLGLSLEQEEFIGRWMNHDFDLVGDGEPPSSNN